MEFALCQAVASGDAFEHRPSEYGHCVQDFLAEFDLWKAHDCPSAFRRFSGASMEHFQYAAITWI